jgi:hypothetical protein
MSTQPIDPDTDRTIEKMTPAQLRMALRMMAILRTDDTNTAIDIALTNLPS